MLALQKLGEKLLELPVEHWQRLALPEALCDALARARTISAAWLTCSHQLSASPPVYGRDGIRRTRRWLKFPWRRELAKQTRVDAHLRTLWLRSRSNFRNIAHIRGQV